MPLNYYETYGVTSITSATATITDEGYLGRPIVLDRAGGITCTLPAATGSGNRYTFLVATTFTGSGIIQVANSSDVMAGLAIVAQDAGDTVVVFETAASSDTVTLNGTTTGGLAGARVDLIDMKTNQWHVRVETAATGTEATPFSAAV